MPETSRPNFYLMNEVQLRRGIENCVNNARELLATSLELTVNRTNASPYAFGLYCFGAEELGKALLLNDILSQSLNELNKSNQCMVPVKIFEGRKAHEKKFERAFQNIPNEIISQVGHFAVSVRTAFPRTTTIRNEYEPSAEVTIAAGTTGIVEDTIAGKVTISRILADIDSSRACFYVDFDDETGDWKSPKEVNSIDLRNAINRLQEEVRNLSSTQSIQ